MGRMVQVLVSHAILVAAFGVLAAGCDSIHTGDEVSSSTAAPSPRATQASTTPSPASSASSSTEALYPGCSAEQLTAVWATGSGYAGGFGEAYLLKNVSNSDCSLYGFPVVMGAHRDGTQQQLYFPQSSYQASPVDLHPGDSAQLQFLFPDCSIGPPEARTPTTSPASYASAAVIPPGGGAVTLPPGTGAPVTHGIPPSTGVDYTCPGSGPQPYAKPWIPAPSPRATP